MLIRAFSVVRGQATEDNARIIVVVVELDA
jgi:hypothetical protein